MNGKIHINFECEVLTVTVENVRIGDAGIEDYAITAIEGPEGPWPKSAVRVVAQCLYNDEMFEDRMNKRFLTRVEDDDDIYDQLGREDY